MRIAVLADIHGNLPALDAVLDDIDAAGVIVLNGDIATGPMPAETLDTLAELGEEAIWMRGNAGRELVAAYDGRLNPDLPDPARPPTEYCASRLDPTSELARRFAIVDRDRDNRAGGQCASATPLRAVIPTSCSSTLRSNAIETPSPIPTSPRSYSITRTCPLTDSPIAVGSSIPGAWECRMAGGARLGAPRPRRHTAAHGLRRQRSRGDVSDCRTGLSRTGRIHRRERADRAVRRRSVGRFLTVD